MQNWRTQRSVQKFSKTLNAYHNRKRTSAIIPGSVCENFYAFLQMNDKYDAHLISPEAFRSEPLLCISFIVIKIVQYNKNKLRTVFSR